MATKLTDDELMTLRWRLYREIEPALANYSPPLSETLQERITRLQITRDVQAKADACIEALEELGLISAPDIVPTTD